MAYVDQCSHQNHPSKKGDLYGAAGLGPGTSQSSPIGAAAEPGFWIEQQEGPRDVELLVLQLRHIYAIE